MGIITFRCKWWGGRRTDFMFGEILLLLEDVAGNNSTCNNFGSHRFVAEKTGNSSHNENQLQGKAT